MGFFDDTKFHSIYDMIDSIDTVVERNVRENMEACNASDLGLDQRAGYRLFVCDECIAVEGDGHLLDYYGGFEYVDKEYVRVVGNWKFYMSDDDRVRDHIETYYEKQGLCESEDAE